ncbi:MAG: hypothetical protein HYU73_07355 [Betaproteobacteria bacterium]|nr:hypothetical protein [Betaproteobacteria bacterium]MBI3055468.1 hypothetical protein [Betaproteobacteria bacterium]
MSATIEVFSNYNPAAWQDRGMLIASAIQPINSKKRRNLSGLKMVVGMSFVAFAITQLQPKIPLTQAFMTWASTSISQANRIHSADYVPSGSWGRLITQIQSWPETRDVFLPDFDSLAG